MPRRLTPTARRGRAAPHARMHRHFNRSGCAPPRGFEEVRRCRFRCTTGCAPSRSRTIARLARCGYDAIEISGEPERYDTKHVRKLLKDHKLTCWGSVTLMLADRDLLAKDEAQRAASVKYVTDTITMVKELGGRDHDRPVDGRQDQAAWPPDEEWKWAVDSLKTCYEHGQGEGRPARDRAAQPVRDLLPEPARPGAGAGQGSRPRRAASASTCST